MSDPSSLFGGPHEGAPARADALVDKHDCGCGCGGKGGCGESKTSTVGSIRQGRRKFLIGGIGVTTFAATLSSRPAFAQGCLNLTGLYSPTGSHQTGVCNASGKTPGFWANHAGCWPTTIHPGDLVGNLFGTTTFPFSTETMAQALCAPNGQDNLAFQIAAGLLNAESNHTNSAFGYMSAQNFANAVIAAINALIAMNISLSEIYQELHDRIAAMNSNNNQTDAWCGQQSVCSG